jgi:hypothetical protein
MRYSGAVVVYILGAVLQGGGFTVVDLPRSISSQSLESDVIHARGTFEVQVKPLPVDAYTDETSMGRMTIDKQFSGDLVGTGKGQMLTGMGGVKGSAAYSAIERVSGTLAGKRGTFVLQHTGIVARGAQSLVITIVPDSGTDELTGISGVMAIIVEGKAHSYDLEYTLPAAP